MEVANHCPLVIWLSFLLLKPLQYSRKRKACLEVELVFKWYVFSPFRIGCLGPILRVLLLRVYCNQPTAWWSWQGTIGVVRAFQEKKTHTKGPLSSEVCDIPMPSSPSPFLLQWKLYALGKCSYGYRGRMFPRWKKGSSSDTQAFLMPSESLAHAHSLLHEAERPEGLGFFQLVVC